MFKALMDQNQQTEEQGSLIKLVPMTSQVFWAGKYLLILMKARSLDVDEVGLVKVNEEFQIMFPSVITSKYLVTGKYYYEVTIKQQDASRRSGNLSNFRQFFEVKNSLYLIFDEISMK